MKIRQMCKDQRESSAQCPLSSGGAHLRSARSRHDRRYFVVFTRPHSGADLLCKLLNRHPEITCAGELFNPTHATSERLGFTVERQRADVQGFVLAHFNRCRTRVCGFRMMASHLPREALPRLFVPGCGVQKVVLERANVTAEFLALPTWFRVYRMRYWLLWGITIRENRRITYYYRNDKYYY